VAQRYPGLNLLVLFGSRARGDPQERSDWDFGFLGDERLDPDGLRVDLAAALGTDDVDLADLAHASGLLRYRAARDGIAVHDASGKGFERFWRDAVHFWCDAEPVLRKGYGAILEELGP
jgi:predicted nucleotidyltransferase